MDTTLYGAGLASYPAGVHLHVGIYAVALRAALKFVCADDGEPYGSLTVNVPEAELADDEILVSADWVFPADLKAALLATEKFVQTGRWTLVGHGRGEVWRIVDPTLLSQIAAARVVASRCNSSARTALAA